MKLYLLITTLVSFSLSAQNLLSERLWKIPGRKKSIYMERGIFHTGNKKVKTELTAIRHSYTKKRGYERFVFDFKGNEIPKVYGHISAKENKLYIDLFDTGINPQMTMMGNSHYIGAVNFFPIDDESLSLELNFKRKASVDIFHLSNPARLVIDIR